MPNGDSDVWGAINGLREEQHKFQIAVLGTLASIQASQAAMTEQLRSNELKWADLSYRRTQIPTYVYWIAFTILTVGLWAADKVIQ